VLQVLFYVPFNVLCSDISNTILVLTSSDHDINVTITTVLGQPVLHDLLTNLEDKFLNPIQFVDEIKTLVFSLNMHNVFKRDVFL